MCQRLKLDVIDCPNHNNNNNNNRLQLGQWPEHLRHFSAHHFSECTRCELGRLCPSDIPCTMVPGDCRYGRWASGTGPRRKGKTQQPTDPLANWKERADRENYDPVRIHDHALQVKPSETRLSMPIGSIMQPIWHSRRSLPIICWFWGSN